MMTALKTWYRRYLGSMEAGYLVFFLSFFVILVSFFNYMLAPVFYSIVIAYLLDGVVAALQRWFRFPHKLAALLVFVVFIALGLLIIFALAPLLVKQLSSFMQDLPDLTAKLQNFLEQLRQRAPYISDAEIQNILVNFKEKLINHSQSLISLSLASIPGLITFIVYFVLAPLLIYFFLVDRQEILAWCRRFLPRHNEALVKIWKELDLQIGNYIRGKVLEAIIVGIMTYPFFLWLGLQYAALLAVGVGISVLIPYIGAVVITIPIVIIGLLQWGFTTYFFYLLIGYAIIMTIDGTILLALLFSGTNNLHPVVIIIATLVFGGIWGFWGVFFAIPLASLTKALLEHWPKNK